MLYQALHLHALLIARHCSALSVLMSGMAADAPIMTITACNHPWHPASAMEGLYFMAHFEWLVH